MTLELCYVWRMLQDGKLIKPPIFASQDYPHMNDGSPFIDKRDAMKMFKESVEYHKMMFADLLILRNDFILVEVVVDES